MGKNFFLNLNLILLLIMIGLCHKMDEFHTTLTCCRNRFHCDSIFTDLKGPLTHEFISSMKYETQYPGLYSIHTEAAALKGVWNTTQGKSPYTLDWTWISNLFPMFNKQIYCFTSAVQLENQLILIKIVLKTIYLYQWNIKKVGF